MLAKMKYIICIQCNYNTYNTIANAARTEKARSAAVAPSCSSHRTFKLSKESLWTPWRQIRRNAAPDCWQHHQGAPKHCLAMLPWSWGFFWNALTSEGA